jgi:Uma2 family endonuclease
MGMSAALDRYYTREEVLAFPDGGNRYELVYGELLVSPPPFLQHQRIVGRVFLALGRFLESNQFGEVLASPAAFPGDVPTTSSPNPTCSS